MKAASLPPEILQEILINLCGLELVRCRQVCKSWKAAVGGLSDSQWKQVCENQFMHAVYERAHERAGIPWRETFQAVNSWAHIETATMECRPLTTRVAHQLRILPNKVVAVLISSRRDLISRHMGMGDTILYCNAGTCKELRRDSYERNIRDFNENEHLIVLVCSNAELLLVTKANKKQQVVGKLCEEDYWNYGQYRLFGKKVYFQDDNYEVCVSELKETKNCQAVITTEPLERCGVSSYIIAFGRDSEGHLTMLNDEGHLDGYDEESNAFGLISKFKHYSDWLIGECMENGLDWTAPPLYQWLRSMYPDNFKTSKEKHHCFCLHGTMILLGLREERTVHLYYNPFTPEGEMDLYDATPTRSIDMNQFARMSKDNNNFIDQIDIIEGVDHHLVLVLTGERVFVLKFGFNPCDEDVKAEDEDQETLPKKRKKNEPKIRQPESNVKKEGKKPKATSVPKREPKNNRPESKAQEKVQRPKATSTPKNASKTNKPKLTVREEVTKPKDTSTPKQSDGISGHGYSTRSRQK